MNVHHGDHRVRVRGTTKVPNGAGQCRRMSTREHRQAMDCPANESPDRRVLRELSNVKTEPVSPTANLRLLTTLASNLKSAPQQDSQFKNVRSEPKADPLKLLPRKEKSLGLLCNKFLSLYPLNKTSNVPQEISLDVTAKALGTEKRRIYDIINVLESLEMASKAGKNLYLWHGQNYLPGTLAKLKSLAVKLGLREQIQEIQQINRAYTTDFSDGSPYFNTPVAHSPNLDNMVLADGCGKEDKSLGVMCQKFVMLFLVSLKNGVINLDIAAKVLITDAEQSSGIADSSVRSRFKTKVRRLYDIANVLTAIGMIKKVSMSDSTIRKPVFKYTGPDVDYIDFDAETPVREGTRHSLIGMATPSRSFTYSFLPQSSSGKQTATPNRLFAGSTTPVTQRRELRKRKLFGADDKFGRTMSSPCLDIERPSDRLDDSILQVAEMELERLKSSEQPKSKVCIKLFPRHNSDSCVSATQVSGELNTILNGLRSPEATSEVEKLDGNLFNKRSHDAGASVIDSRADTASDEKSSMASAKENLVEKSACNASNSLQTTSFNSPLKVNVPSFSAQTSAIRLAPKESDATAKIERNIKPFKLKVRDPNIMAIKNTTSKKFIIKDFALDNTKMVRIAPYKIQPRTSTPKFVNLANFDAKKLIPIKTSNFKVTTPTLQPIIVENPNPANTSYAILTQVQTPVLSPGDLFEAVQVGNTLQLVPLCNQNTIKFTNEIHNQSTTNSS